LEKEEDEQGWEEGEKSREKREKVEGK